MCNLFIVEATFWIRVYHLPFMVWSIYIGQLIKNTLGQTKKVDLEEDDVEWEEYMRIRVTLNITKPTLRRKRLAIDGLESIWV